MNWLSKTAAATAVLTLVGAGAAYAHRDWYRDWHRGDRGGPMMGGGRMGGRMLDRLCGSKDPITGERIAARLSDRLNLTDTQKPALKDLQEAFAKSMTDAKTLCDPKPDLSTVTGRVAFAQKRFSVMAAGLANVQPKLDAFYAALDDKQKEHFNHMGPGGHHDGGDDRWRDRRGWNDDESDD
jgi:LTXXQ motif family protein